MTEEKMSFSADSLEYKLGRFNAKERFALIQRVLGVEFVPHAGFLSEVLAKCGINAKPERVFCAMDFHLDWLYAALISNELRQDEPLRLLADEAGVLPVTGRQQDADFVMCFTERPATAPAITHLLLVEAKGVGSWDAKQMRSKLAQYRAMKPAFDRNPNVRPRLVLMSPQNPIPSTTRQSAAFRNVIDSFNEFGEVVWVELPVDNTFSVVRCNAEGAPDGKTPTHWKLSLRQPALS
ncbi:MULTISPECIES: hypothetical protein [Paraburkholderia]|uniref:Uncharacterized protein n=1 Tax=Paraburkholderia podalyriae TaxID=1938811 RepID=A0ABR7Q1H2_9BURK|nr:hypothetical protein [Paraburkholderia podalyriae]MBC8752405.1 hypothetical protein [Paraburkholderia podalyriae]